jgi:hypothetical protein
LRQRQRLKIQLAGFNPFAEAETAIGLLDSAFPMLHDIPPEASELVTTPVRQ